MSTAIICHCGHDDHEHTPFGCETCATISAARPEHPAYRPAYCMLSRERVLNDPRCENCGTRIAVEANRRGLCDTCHAALAPRYHVCGYTGIGVDDEHIVACPQPATRTGRAWHGTLVACERHYLHEADDGSGAWRGERDLSAQERAMSAIGGVAW